jgi:hypothetical protein
MGEVLRVESGGEQDAERDGEQESRGGTSWVGLRVGNRRRHGELVRIKSESPALSRVSPLD